MVSPQPQTKLTYEDYIKTPDDERWELIDGELITPAAPSVSHQRVVFALGKAMDAFVVERELGEVMVPAPDVVLSDTNTVQPDLLFVSKERADIITPANVQGAPDVMVEVRSPSTARLDWVVKRELYAR